MKPRYNPADALDLAAANHGGRTAIHYGKKALSVSDCAHITRQLAQLLADRGVGAGDRVALVARNCPYHMLLHIACARIGAIFVPVSYRFAQPELRDVLDFVQPVVVVVDPETAQVCDSWIPADTFVIDDDDEFAPLPSDLWVGFAPLSASYRLYQGTNIFLRDTDDSQGGAMLLTSGSTGRPKAVYLTHEQLWWGSQNFREGFEYSNYDVELVTVPLTHVGGFNGTTLDLFSHGGTIVIIREFDPGRVLAEIEQHRVAMMFAVPTIYAALLAHPDFGKHDLSSLRLPLIGGAICPPDLLSRMAQHGLRPLNVWGMTEAAAAGFMLSQDLLEEAPGAIGIPFPHVHAKIVDSRGCESDTGELVISGPNVVDGYWHDSGFTAEACRDGWLYTGDMARRDEAGYVWVLGRIGQQINTGGEKVNPEEVSHVLRQLAYVRDVAVVGIPDPVWGEAVAAAVVLAPGAELPEIGEIREFVAQHIARYKAPRVAITVTALPTNANGKVDMAAVKELIEQSV
ncbi:class I adenylate-forming enzyme family protein [Arcanobacterium phocae]|uniref:class I adenylate-forming enzyme family protein n=1 Tax=Arcanobacterium phocae TaxID=131112 RepID=UPI001C0EC572|nr:AMP-binding protein [Arcanobacterium phocae]